MQQLRLVEVPPRWRGERCVVAATGPSLTPDVAERLSDESNVIAVNDAYRLLPTAPTLYACDSQWWKVNEERLRGSIVPRHPAFSGERWTTHDDDCNTKVEIAERMGLTVVRGRDGEGFSLDPSVIHYGHNSGFQAVNLALLMGADPIVLVGFDMREVDGRRHFFGAHQRPLHDGAMFSVWVSSFYKADAILLRSSERVPTIINATPGSALRCFPMKTLEEALTIGSARAA